MLVEVGTVADFSEGKMRVVQAADREIGVALWRGVFFALRNVCPHQSGPLCLGPLTHYLNADPDAKEVQVDEDELVVSCPWHRWQFHLRTGKSIWDPRYSVKTYQVEVSEGRVFVRVPGRQRNEV